MFEKYKRFISGVSVSTLGKIGVVLTTSSFITMILFELARLTGVLTNAYIGLVTYMLLPLVFVIGLIIIPFAWRKYLWETGKTTKEALSEQFGKEEIKGGFLGSKLVTKVTIFTGINVLFLLLVSAQMFTFMDSAEFCGTACHSVMNPEWVVYQDSPHAKVACVECHVGQGVDALVASKLNGAYQILSVTFNLYEKPIPTPVHNLRPANETCESCHWREKAYGSRFRTNVHYQDDEKSTALYTTLALKIDIGKEGEKAGIHWHTAEQNEVRYKSVDDKRLEMIWVDVKQSDGSFKRFYNSELDEAEVSDLEEVRMDCVDCHNRATHIYEDPSKAIDHAIYNKKIVRSLPFIKREALDAITDNYKTKEQGKQGIADHLYSYYRRNHPDVFNNDLDDIDNAVSELQKIYNRNIHPGMNIQWGSYPNHIGHEKDLGCFRCHNRYMKDEQGTAISYDCTTCHSILANESKQPFQFLKIVNEKDPLREEHQYLQEEFYNSYMR